MIARRIPPKINRAGGFKRLGQYIATNIANNLGTDRAFNDNGTAGGDATDQLGTYITDQVRHDDRVEWTRITNCHFADSIKGAIAEISATQTRNTRMKTDANYHLLVSFPPGEIPTRAQIEDIEDTLVAGLGLAAHQRISALHADKAHLHLHVAINLIHPDTHKAARIWRDHTKLAELAEVLEQKHGLQRTNHEFPSERNQPRQEAEINMKTHTAQEPFTEWVKRVACTALKDAGAQTGDWQSLHAAAAGFGLELRRRGAGLVIGQIGEPALNMKMSDIDRALGYQQLVARFGAFEPPADQTAKIQPHATYSRSIPPNARENKDLWKQYQSDRSEGLKARAALDERGRKYLDDLNLYYRDQYADLKRWRTEILDPRIRAEALRRERAKDMANFRSYMQSERSKLATTKKVETWPDWLRRQAAQGNHDAAAELRRQASKQERFTQTLVRAPVDARRVVRNLDLRPKTTRGGETVYRMPDGGTVVEKKDGLHMPMPSRAAAILVLDLVQERTAGAPLSLNGTPDQVKAILDAAVQLRAPISFADPDLERERQRQMAEQLSGGPSPASDRDDAMAAIIAGRTRWPAPGDTTKWRAIDMADHGPAEFVATLKVRGAEVAIWRTDAETLIQDISGQRDFIAFRLSPGDRLLLDSVINHTVMPDTAPGGGVEPDQEYEL